MSNSTKDDIIAAAVELFAAGGYHDTSMAKIADKAGISKGTLYWYFSGKEELFRELIMAGFNMLFSKVHKIVEQDIPAEEMLHQYIESKISFLEKHRKISKIAVENLEIISPELKEKAMQKHKEMLDYVSVIINKGKEEKVFKDINTVDTALLIIGMTNCINSEDFMFVNIDKRSSKVEFIYNVIKNGIARRE